MADIGTTTRVGIRRERVQPRIAASGPTPGTPTTSSGLYSRGQATAPTADVRIASLRSNHGADYLLAPPDPPSFGSFSPAAGAVARAAAVTFSVTDPSGFENLLVWGTLGDGTIEMVYDGSGFSSAFNAGSSVSGSTTLSVTVQRDTPGWTANYTLHALATNTLGRTSEASSAYTLTNPPSAPVVTFTPISGGSISRSASVQIDVTDVLGASSLVLLLVTAILDDGSERVAAVAGTFKAPFTDGSSRSSISGGYRYIVAWDGTGWPSSTAGLRVEAMNAEGLLTQVTWTAAITNAPAPPVIGGWSPAAGAIARAAGVDFDVTSPDGFESITVWAVLGDGTSVVVYDGAGFGAEVDAGSAVAGTTTRSFTVAHDGAGWANDYTLHVRATDTLGRTSIASQAYTLSNPPAPADATAPTVTLVSPAEGSSLARTDPVVIEVTDASAFAALFVYVTYAGAAADDLAHTGTSFTTQFAGSSRTSITGGYRYTLRRVGGWPANPTVHVHPVDTAGNTP